MNSFDLFYLLKPLIPRQLQIALRRFVARKKLRKIAAYWPIWPIAGEKPKNWKGWPDGKKFAIVLIHDVDTKVGRDRCLNLAELESSMGFRSAYYFVPEDYHVPKALRQQLMNSGFEIGLHGLTHDGRKYRNYKTFSSIVPKIKMYLKDWEAVGYTSPSTLGNLRWISDLNIEYSCSSFDTDPFEPRPFGVATIFPFIVMNSSGTRSYVEIPYTLPQDYSLFNLLCEKDIVIWKRKLDWVASKGGVALLNTHPDYMNFDNGINQKYTYPSRFFAEFLSYVSNRYEGQFWNCLPRTLAHFWRSSFPEDASYSYYGGEISAVDRVAIYSNKGKIDWDTKLALACTPGGHYEQMQNLSDFYKKHPYFWITIKSAQTLKSLKDEAPRYFINYAHFKKPWTYLQQIPRVIRILKKEKPTHIISTGSGIVVFIPFLLSRLFKIQFIHIETFSHVSNLTKVGKLLAKLHHPFLSQWKAIKHKKVAYIGPIITDRTHPYGDALLKHKIDDNIVFVTLGMRVEQFPRLLKYVEALVMDRIIKQRVIVQAGSTIFKSALMDIFGFCSPDQIDEYIASAEYVITQESAGLVTKCLKSGKRFIVMPRDYQFRELPTKSDMQEDLHYKLADLGYTYVVHNQDQLKEAIQNIDRLKTGYRFDNRQAIAYLDNLIKSL